MTQPLLVICPTLFKMLLMAQSLLVSLPVDLCLKKKSYMICNCTPKNSNKKMQSLKHSVQPCSTFHLSHTPVVSQASGEHRQAYDSLLDVLQTRNSQTSCSTVIKAPVRTEHPSIKFWTKQEWMANCSDDITTTDKTRGKSRAAQGINVTMRFAELEDGTIVDGHAAGNIRRCARSAWVHLANKGEAPSKWRSASAVVIRSYHDEMYRRFPFLQYCDNDWKAEQIAIDNYPSWYNSWCKKTNTARSSVNNIKDEREEPLVSTKRPNDTALDTETKRIKVAPQAASVTIQVDGAVGSSDLNFKVRYE